MLTPAEAATRLMTVQQRIVRAAESCGRDPREISLLAVSKLHPPEAIRALYAAGQRDFGENYVQELVTKRAALADLSGLRWHMIGHVQRNKARAVAENADKVHSVDSVRLAQALATQVTQLGRPPLPVFVQVNISGEVQKGGCLPNEVGSLVTAVRATPALELVGLMGIPEALAAPADVRAQYERLLAIRDALGGAGGLPELSLGMSQDLEVAIACGSTCVRVGTDLFGARPT